MRLIALLLIGIGLSGCNTATTSTATYEPASEANLKPRDRELLAKVPYAKPTIPEPYRRHIVNYHRKEAPGSIVVDADSRFLYYVLPEGKAIRYGITVGEEALAFSGIAKVQRKAEWPTWTPTQAIKERLGPSIPNQVGPGPHNPLGARALYLYAGGKDTLYRIHGTNQPDLIGSAVSSGCIRMTNEDVIDLYNRTKENTVVVVLAPKQGDSPTNPQMAHRGLDRILPF
jgi:lipoprotein-anchoring transpeptidase ErfK/SrfK